LIGLVANCFAHADWLSVAVWDENGAVNSDGLAADPQESPIEIPKTAHVTTLITLRCI
jgi:uncharacterized protein YraI